MPNMFRLAIHLLSMAMSSWLPRNVCNTAFSICKQLVNKHNESVSLKKKYKKKYKICARQIKFINDIHVNDWCANFNIRKTMP